MQNFSEVDEDRRVSFNAGAERYDAVRPSYPDTRVDDVIEGTRKDLIEDVAATGLFEAADVALYPWTATLTTTEYLTLLGTYSDHAILAPDYRQRIHGAIAEAIERHGGTIEIPYVSMACLAKRI